MRTCIRRVSSALIFFIFTLAVTAPVRADEVDSSLRKKRWEIMLAPQYTLAKNLGFDGGTTAKVEDTVGFNFQFGYNFNEHWSLGGLFSWSRPDYQAVVQPAQGNPLGPRSQTGTIETNTFAMIATYNVLAGPITPFIDVNLGGTYVHTDIADGPPGDRTACVVESKKFHDPCRDRVPSGGPLMMAAMWYQGLYLGLFAVSQLRHNTSIVQRPALPSRMRQRRETLRSTILLTMRGR